MADERPRMRIRPQKGDKVLELTGWVLLLATWVLVIASYSGLPENIPSHFDFLGHIAGWGGRVRIFILPAISTILLLLITYFNFHPHRLNYPFNIHEDNAFVNYFVAIRFNRWVKILVAIIFLVISYRTIQMSHGRAGIIGFWTLPVLIILLLIPMATLIIYLIKKDRTTAIKK